MKERSLRSTTRPATRAYAQMWWRFAARPGWSSDDVIVFLSTTYALAGVLEIWFHPFHCSKQLRAQTAVCHNIFSVARSNESRNWPCYSAHFAAKVLDTTPVNSLAKQSNTLVEKVWRTRNRKAILRSERRRRLARPIRGHEIPSRINPHQAQHSYAAWKL